MLVIRWLVRSSRAGRRAGLDPITGLYYVRNRWYDPVMNRFVSEDPIGLTGGINMYAYVGNNPLNARDPLGLFESDECIEWFRVTINTRTGQAMGEIHLGTSCPNSPFVISPLSPVEQERVRCVTQTYLSAEARDIIMPMLRDRLLFKHRHMLDAAAVTNVDYEPITIVFSGAGRGTIRGPDYALAYVIGHEARHVQQANGTLGPRENYLAMRASPSWYNRFNPRFEWDARTWGHAQVNRDTPEGACPIPPLP
jgi:RHS repeat-associated protein